MSSRRGKRGIAAPSPVAEAQEGRAAKRRAVAPGAYAEGDASLEPGESPADIQIQHRAFWEQFDTALLLAWLLDFSDHKKFLKKAKYGDREHLLDILVERAEPPKLKKGDGGLAALQSVWRQQHPNAPPQEVPGLFSLVAEDAADAADDAGAPPEDEDEAPHVAFSRLEQEEKYPSPPPQRGPAHMAAVVESIRAYDRAQRALPPVDEACCMTCARPRPPADSHRAMWLCACGRRGDLPFDHPVNVSLVPSSASSQGRSTPAASEGQATPTITAAAVGTDPWERRFAALLAEQRSPHPDFAADATISATEALAISRSAFGATATERPPARLLEVIRSGRLTNPAYAVPRPLDRDKSKDADLFGITGAGLLAPVADAKQEPKCASSSQFCSALFSTILPALADRPRALMQWVALGRTALQIESQRGWVAAWAYVRRALSDSLGQDPPQAFAGINQHVLEGVNSEFPLVPANGGARPQQQQQQQQRAKTCNAFNTVPGCTYPNCSYRHSCSTCGSNSHTAVSAECKGRGAQGSGQSRGGGGRGGRSNASARSSQSVTTAATPTKPAASS